MTDDCIFCKIIRGEIPCYKVYEDDKHLAFLDLSPIVKGHTLIIPKAHHETILDMEKDEFKEMMGVIHTIAASIVGAVEPDGYNVYQNNKPEAGQVIPHVHFHVIPRYSDDGHKIHWKPISYEEGEIETYTEKIKNKIN